MSRVISSVKTRVRAGRGSGSGPPSSRWRMAARRTSWTSSAAGSGRSPARRRTRPGRVSGGLRRGARPHPPRARHGRERRPSAGCRRRGTDKGGALAEINLPLHSKEHPNSSIRKIEADSAADTYYPLRKGLVGKDPRHYALTILSDGPVVNYQVKNQTKTSITFESVDSNRTITKTFSFPENQEKSPYCIELAVQIEGDARNLRLTSGIPEVELVSGSPAPALKYRLVRNQKAVVESLDLPKTENSLSSVEPLWVCNSNGFLGLIIQPLTEIGTGFNTINVPRNSRPFSPRPRQ